jgi:hypothetical protein
MSVHFQGLYDASGFVDEASGGTVSVSAFG